MEFKVGDTVRLVSTDTRYASDEEWCKVGKFEIAEEDFNTQDTYTIINVNPEGNSICVKGLWFPKCYFKLVEEDKPYNLNPYIGEYLVVIKDTIFYSVPLKKGECIQIVGKGKWKKSSNLSNIFVSTDIYTSDIFRTATAEEEIEFDRVYKKELQIKPIDLEPIVPNIIVPIDRKKIKRTVGIIPTKHIIINR